MDREAIRDYVALRKECDENMKRIERLRDEIDNMTPNTQAISDTVTKGKKGKRSLGTVKIESEQDYRNINRRKSELYRRLAKWHVQTGAIADEIAEIESMIAEVRDPDTRRLLCFACLDGKNWREVSEAMGEGWSEEACRQRYSRFIRGTEERK